MAPQYFPVQTLKNMGASIEIVAIKEGEPFSVEGCKVTARTNPHGRSGALASDWFYLGRVRSLDEISAALDALTPESVTGYAARQDLDAMTILTLGPSALQMEKSS